MWYSGWKLETSNKIHVEKSRLCMSKNFGLGKEYFKWSTPPDKIQNFLNVTICAINWKIHTAKPMRQYDFFVGVSAFITKMVVTFQLKKVFCKYWLSIDIFYTKMFKKLCIRRTFSWTNVNFMEAALWLSPRKITRWGTSWICNFSKLQRKFVSVTNST